MNGLALFQLWRTGEEIGSIRCEPLLASWDHKTHPAQVRLRAYLDRAAAELGDLPLGPLFLDLTVQVQKPEHLLRYCDLENYLTPLVHRLGSSRFVYVVARKQLEATSGIRVGNAVPMDAPLDSRAWTHFAYAASAGVQQKRWKEELRAALISFGPAPLPAGCVAVHLAWRCSSKRNWTCLWKPTGDAMGPVLGEPDPRNPFNPADDRITELHLQVNRDDAMGHAVDVGMWWKLDV